MPRSLAEPPSVGKLSVPFSLGSSAFAAWAQAPSPGPPHATLRVASRDRSIKPWALRQILHTDRGTGSQVCSMQRKKRRAGSSRRHGWISTAERGSVAGVYANPSNPTNKRGGADGRLQTCHPIVASVNAVCVRPRPQVPQRGSHRSTREKKATGKAPNESAQTQRAARASLSGRRPQIHQSRLRERRAPNAPQYSSSTLSRSRRRPLRTRTRLGQGGHSARTR